MGGGGASPTTSGAAAVSPDKAESLTLIYFEWSVSGVQLVCGLPDLEETWALSLPAWLGKQPFQRPALT